MLPRPNWMWLLGVALSTVAIGIGLYCYYDHVEHGLIVSAMRSPGEGGAAWGLAIVFYMYFVGLSFASFLIVGLTRLLHLEMLRPIIRVCELLCLFALAAGAAGVMTDLGRPFDALIKLPRYANPRSPFFGTFTLVDFSYLFATFVYLFLSSRDEAAKLAEQPGKLRLLYKVWGSGYRDVAAHRIRHRIVTRWLVLTLLPVLVLAYSTFGFIFGTQSGRPGWYSALQAPAVVVLAGVSGIGGIILVSAGVRRMLRLYDRIPDETFRWLGNFQWVLSSVYSYFMIVEVMTSLYEGPEADRTMMHAIIAGPFAPFFWITVVSLLGSFVIPFVLYLRRKTSVRWIVIAAGLANIAGILKRYLLVLPSQTHGALTPTGPSRMYVPTLAEYGILLGLFGIVAFGVLVFVVIFPPIAEEPEIVDPTSDRPRDLLRTGLTSLTVLTGLGLMAVGLSDSLRLWSHGEIDPRIPYSPVVFASGAILLFCAAVVYEVLPDARPARSAAPSSRDQPPDVGTGPAMGPDHVDV